MQVVVEFLNEESEKHGGGEHDRMIAWEREEQGDGRGKEKCATNRRNKPSESCSCNRTYHGKDVGSHEHVVASRAICQGNGLVLEFKYSRAVGDSEEGLLIVDNGA